MMSPAPTRWASQRSDDPKPRRGRLARCAAAAGRLDRRAFCRAVVLAATGGLAWLLLRRSCAGQGACAGCASHAGCDLPWKEAPG